MTDCGFVDEVITAYVDGESVPDVRERVLRHVDECSRCRARVDAETTARRVLRAHAEAARRRGVRPPWTPRVFRLGKPALTLPASAAISLTIAASIVIAIFALRSPSVETVGVIGDSRCGLHHVFAERFHVDEQTCTLNCVRLGASFVLLANGAVYTILNQDYPDLARFASARVTVSGTIRGNRISVLRIASASD